MHGMSGQCHVVMWSPEFNRNCNDCIAKHQLVNRSIGRIVWMIHLQLHVALCFMYVTMRWQVRLWTQTGFESHWHQNLFSFFPTGVFISLDTGSVTLIALGFQLLLMYIKDTEQLNSHCDGLCVEIRPGTQEKKIYLIVNPDTMRRFLYLLCLAALWMHLQWWMYLMQQWCWL